MSINAFLISWNLYVLQADSDNRLLIYVSASGKANINQSRALQSVTLTQHNHHQNKNFTNKEHLRRQPVSEKFHYDVRLFDASSVKFNANSFGKRVKFVYSTIDAYDARETGSDNLFGFLNRSVDKLSLRQWDWYTFIIG